MSTEADIVERLRKHVNDRGGASIDNGAWQMMLDAADEIERWKGVARIEAEGRQRMLELGQQAHDRAHAAARDMRERCAAWHDEQCYSGHCGETTADKIFRQRHNKMHEEAAYNIRLLDTPAVIATKGGTQDGL